MADLRGIHERLCTETGTAHTPESLVEGLRGERDVVLLRSALFESPQARYSFVTARISGPVSKWGK